jgi:hypothetical protein
MVCFRPQPVAAGYAVRNSALSRRVDGSTSHAGVAGLPVMPGVACFAEFSPPDTADPINAGEAGPLTLGQRLLSPHEV